MMKYDEIWWNMMKYDEISAYETMKNYYINQFISI